MVQDDIVRRRPEFSRQGGLVLGDVVLSFRGWFVLDDVSSRVCTRRYRLGFSRQAHTRQHRPEFFDSTWSAMMASGTPR